MSNKLLINFRDEVALTEFKELMEMDISQGCDNGIMTIEAFNDKIWLSKADLECLIEGEEITINDMIDIEVK